MDDEEYIREIINSFAKRAFRIKQPSPVFLDKLFDLYTSAREVGAPVGQAIKEPLAVVLASPGFLYLTEPNKDGQPRELTDSELAVRLS